MRKWHLLACGVAVQALVFLACGTADEPQAPMIADCMHDCGSPPLSGGGTSGVPEGGGGIQNDATTDAATAPDALDLVDVGVQGNDVFGDTSASGFVDVGVQGNDVFQP